MAGRKAAPKPAAPKTTNRQRRQSRVETNSDTPVDRSRMEEDLGKLVDSLTQWTREMQAVRPAAREASAPRRRSPSRAKKVAVKALATPLYERGNPLTQSMNFTDRDGKVWLAYVEGAEPAPTHRLRRPTTLPVRRLRFDSATESRFTISVPAGSPWLAEARLQSLLDQARPDQPTTETAAGRAAGDWVVEWPLRAAKSGQEAVAGGYRRWQEGATQRKALGRKVLDMASEAVESVHGITDVILGHRPARS
jgi:predicted secreted protein